MSRAHDSVLPAHLGLAARSPRKLHMHDIYAYMHDTYAYMHNRHGPPEMLVPGMLA